MFSVALSVSSAGPKPRREERKSAPRTTSWRARTVLSGYLPSGYYRFKFTNSEYTSSAVVITRLLAWKPRW